MWLKMFPLGFVQTAQISAPIKPKQAFQRQYKPDNNQLRWQALIYREAGKIFH
jgi:hypothetical protein